MLNVTNGDSAVTRLRAAIDTDEEIVLWFETDLYDVLQLAQIADRVTEALIVLVGQHEFRGVAELSDDEIRSVSPEPFDRSLPSAVACVQRARPTGAQRPARPPSRRPRRGRAAHGGAPWTTDGLNRSRRALLQGDGPEEERPFLGDTIASDYLEGRVHPRAARYDPATKRLV